MESKSQYVWETETQPPSLFFPLLFPPFPPSLSSYFLFLGLKFNILNEFIILQKMNPSFQFVENGLRPLTVRRHWLQLLDYR